MDWKWEKSSLSVKENLQKTLEVSPFKENVNKWWSFANKLHIRTCQLSIDGDTLLWSIIGVYSHCVVQVRSQVGDGGCCCVCTQAKLSGWLVWEKKMVYLQERRGALCVKRALAWCLPASDTTCILKPSILTEGLIHDISTVFSFSILNFKSEGGSTASKRQNAVKSHLRRATCMNGGTVSVKRIPGFTWIPTTNASWLKHTLFVVGGQAHGTDINMWEGQVRNMEQQSK